MLHCETKYQYKQDSCNMLVTKVNSNGQVCLERWNIQLWKWYRFSLTWTLSCRGLTMLTHNWHTTHINSTYQQLLDSPRSRHHTPLPLSFKPQSAVKLVSSQLSRR